MEFITIENDIQIRFSVPADLNCISTYILLEQGKWFEKEVEFLCRYAAPGMTALDIGANVGVYTLPLAKLLGPTGQVIAYEPGAINRQHLERSLGMNQCRNVVVSSAALSDRPGSGWLQIEGSGELNHLVTEHTESDRVEAVEVSTLDAELDRFNWAQVDIVKIDAEGQETAILNGGRRFFDTYSPLILFEIRHRSDVNHSLIDAFQTLGFDVYRLLGDGSMLAAMGDAETIDPFELNLFAARRDKARQIADAGLLAFPGELAGLSAAERSDSIARYCGLPFALAFGISTSDVEQCPFAEALVAYAAYRFLPSLSPDKRLALLQKAYDDLLAYCGTSNSPAALSSLSRVAHDFGHRGIALDGLQHLLDSENAEIDQPFFPPSLRFEALENLAEGGWFDYAVKEVLELRSSYSSFSGHDLSRLNWLAAQDAGTDEITRRLVLTGLIPGTPSTDVRKHLARLQETGNEQNDAWSKTIQSLMARTRHE